jgi:hypothetical protein
MNKKLLSCLCFIALLGSIAYGQKKKTKEIPTVGSRISMPSSGELAGKLEERDEYKVYSSILIDLFSDNNGRALVLRRLTDNRTVTDFNNSKILSSVDYSFPQLTAKTLSDFVNKNEKSYELLGEYFDTANKVILVADTQNVTSGAKSCEESWKKFYRAYPTARGYMILTRAGFNPEKSQAFVYVQYWIDCKEGGGEFYFLQKDGDNWKVTKTLTMWINGS